MGKKYGLSQAPVFKESGDICETSPFGEKRGNYIHKGVDVVRNIGRNTTATIVAIADGRVIAVKNTVKGVDHVKNLEGNYVSIDHGNGLVSKYFHLAYGTIPGTVLVGKKIAKGTVIGKMGNTGDSYGAHLHFQLEKNGVPIDGAPYLKGQKRIGGKTKDDYIAMIVEKVGFDNPLGVIVAFKGVQHQYATDLFRKLYEALK